MKTLVVLLATALVGCAPAPQLGTFDVPGVKSPKPFWAEGRLVAEKPLGFRGLARVSRAGYPAFDPTTQAWYASAEGALVRVEADGKLPMLADDVQGLDLDVRAGEGLAVSREPDDRIVLHRFRGAASGKQVLLEGQAFFHPRFSPDGSSVLVSESRAGGGHLWLVDLASGAARDLGQGYDAAWHPDGNRIVFVRIEHDGLVVTASTLFLLELDSGQETALARTEGDASALSPAISPDGDFLAHATAGGESVVVTSLGGGR